jgi:hypothetical protein
MCRASSSAVPPHGETDALAEVGVGSDFVTRGHLTLGGRVVLVNRSHGFADDQGDGEAAGEPDGEEAPNGHLSCPPFRLDREGKTLGAELARGACCVLYVSEQSEAVVPTVDLDLREPLAESSALTLQAAT